MIVAHAICPPAGAIVDLFDEITQRLALHEEVTILVPDAVRLTEVERRRQVRFGRRAGLLSPRLFAELRSLRRQSPEIVLVWTQHPLSIIPMLVFRRSHRVAWWHEPVNRGQVGIVKRVAYRTYEWLVIRRAETILVASDNVARSVPARHADRLSVLPFPSLSSFAQPSTVFDASPTDLIFFGVLAPHKGLDVLAAALEILRSEGMTPTLRIAGPGDLATAAPAMHRYSICHKEQVVVEHGYLDGDDLASAVRAATAAVLPYLSAAGSTTTAIAHRLGTPVLASAVGAFADEIKPGQDGWLVPPGDVVALSNALRDAVDNPLDVAPGLDEGEPWQSRFLCALKGTTTP